MFNKGIFVSLLLSSSFVFAQNSAHSSEKIEKDKQVVNFYQNENGNLISNKFDKNKIPESVSSWVNWVKRDNPTLDCPLKENSASNCIFIMAASLEENNTTGTINLELKGSAYAHENWIKVPSNKELWPQKVFINNKESIIAEKNGLSYVKTEKGDLNIIVQYSKNEFKKLQSFELPNELLSFTNKSSLKIAYENGLLYLNKEEVKTELNKENTNILNEVKVFRKLTDSIPLLLETKITVTYSGVEKEMELGQVLPKDFILLNASSDLKITYRDNKYYTNIRAGEHFFKFNAYNKNNPQSIIVSNLVPQVEQEIWSINVNPNIRQLNITQAQQVDANQVMVPTEWREIPSYLVSKEIGLLTEKRGVNLNNTVNITENRNSWYGYNGNKMMNNSLITVHNNNEQYFSVNPQIKLYSIKINDTPQMLVKKDQQQGIISYANNFDANIQTEISDIYNIPTKFFNADITNQEWNLNLAPRYRLLGGTGVEDITGSWMNSWNLYNLFALCIITLSFYKLFGKTLAALAFISIISFQDNSFLTWIIWIGILLVCALLRVLPEEKYSQLTSTVKKLGIGMVIILTVFTIPYISNEIRLIINPSLEMKYSNNGIDYPSFAIIINALCYMGIVYCIYSILKTKKYIANILKMIGIFFLLGVFSGGLFLSKKEEPTIASAPVALPAPMQKSANMESNKSYSPLNNRKSDLSSNDVLGEIEKTSKIKKEEEKIQVGIALPTWDGKNYYIHTDKSSTSKVSLIIAPPLVVNIIGVLQIIILLITMCMIILYLLYAYNKIEWMEKVPSKIKNNWLIKKLLQELSTTHTMQNKGE